MQSTHIITHFQTSINVPNIQVEIITYTQQFIGIYRDTIIVSGDNIIGS